MASILWIPCLFTVASYLLYCISANLPQLQQKHGNSLNESDADADSGGMKFPSNLEELNSLAAVLSAYKRDHLVYVLLLYCSAYLYKQTFSIPGSVFMNLLAGAIFGMWVGFPLACVLTALGATNCYLLSQACGKHYIVTYFPDRLAAFHQKIEDNMDGLFFFLMFLRLFPVTPNWFLNVTAPIVNIPMHLFFFSVFFGLMPYNFICVQTGCLLSQLKSVNEIWSLANMVKLFVMASMALIPGLVMKRLQAARSKPANQLKDKST